MDYNQINTILKNIKDNNKSIYIMGCGGISMSIISDYLLKNNYNVVGVDLKLNKVLQKDKYIKLLDQHHEDNLNNCHCLIVSHFFTDGNFPEIIYARNNNIPIILRIDFLNYMAQQVKNNNKLIGVIGTCGKTTTTYFGFQLSKMLGHNPSIFGGSYLPTVGNNYFLGDRDIFFENDESRDEHLRLKADVMILTALFQDHLEAPCYDNNFQKLKDSFLKQINQIPMIIYYSDKGIIDDLIAKSNKIIGIDAFSYSDINGESHCFVQSFNQNHLGSMGNVIIKKNGFKYNLNLCVPFQGIKNFLNYCANIFYQINENNYKKIIDVSRFVHMASERYTYCGESNNVILINNFSQIVEEFLGSIKSYKDLYPSRKIYMAIELIHIARYNREISDFCRLESEVDGIFMAPVLNKTVHIPYSDDSLIQNKDLKKTIFFNTMEEFQHHLKKFIANNEKPCVLICSGYTKPHGLYLLENLSTVEKFN